MYEIQILCRYCLYIFYFNTDLSMYSEIKDLHTKSIRILNKIENYFFF